MKWPPYVGMIAAICLGEGSLFVMPFLVGAMTELYRIPEGSAGLAMSFQMFVMMSASILISINFHRIGLRTVGKIAGLVILCGHTFSYFAPTWEVFLATRIVVGVGEGLALAVANGAAARTANVHRAFSVLTFSMSLMGVVFYGTIPFLTEQFGFRSTLLLLVGLGAVSLPALFLLPKERGDVTAVPFDPIQKHFSKSVKYAKAILAFTIFYIGINSLWSYTERIGTSIDLTTSFISKAYLIAAVCGLISPFIANWAGNRWGMKRPLVAGVLIQVAGSLLIGYSSDAASFAIGIVSILLGYLFLLPFYKTIMSMLDPTGRLVGAAAGFQAGGTILGPGTAGLLLLIGGSYIHIVYLSACLIVVATSLIAITITQRD